MPVEINFMSQNLETIRQLMGMLPEFGQEATRTAAETFQRLIRGETPYDTGVLKSGWTEPVESGDGFSFENPTEYAIVLEEGLYPGEGPKTVQTERGIFSREAREGMMEPYIADETVIDDVLTAVAEQILREVERYV